MVKILINKESGFAVLYENLLLIQDLRLILFFFVGPHRWLWGCHSGCETRSPEPQPNRK